MDFRNEREEHTHIVVEDNSPGLLAYFLRRVDSPEDAADLLAETLLVIWRRRDALPGDHTEARMWLFGVARKVLLTHRRTLHRRSALHDKLREELASAPRSTTADVDHLEVRDAIARLDSLDQEIIRLSYWDGFTLAQIAKMLRLADGTVRSRHHRALRSLRETLGRPTGRPTVTR